ncbi:MAG: glycosyltransferase, partial [Balneola sp.]
MNFKVSVITPVYNAAEFLRKSVESAVNMDEVGEIILIEDGSTDNSLEICKALENEFTKVILYIHEEGKNKGAGASRNVGISKATFEFISFLDADDFYLENRFELSKKIFSEKPDADGIYEATGIFYYSNDAKQNYFDSKGKDKVLTTVKNEVHPDLFFDKYIQRKVGHFTTDAITLKREVFDKVGGFNTELRLHQDSELWYRIAFHCRLYAGNISNPVAVRGVHEKNRIVHSGSKSKFLLYESLFNYFKN